MNIAKDEICLTCISMDAVNRRKRLGFPEIVEAGNKVQLRILIPTCTDVKYALDNWCDLSKAHRDSLVETLTILIDIVWRHLRHIVCDKNTDSASTCVDPTKLDRATLRSVEAVSTKCLRMEETLREWSEQTRAGQEDVILKMRKLLLDIIVAIVSLNLYIEKRDPFFATIVVESET